MSKQTIYEQLVEELGPLASKSVAENLAKVVCIMRVNPSRKPVALFARWPEGSRRRKLIAFAAAHLKVAVEDITIEEASFVGMAPPADPEDQKL